MINVKHQNEMSAKVFGTPSQSQDIPLRHSENYKEAIDHTICDDKQSILDDNLIASGNSAFHSQKFSNEFEQPKELFCANLEKSQDEKFSANLLQDVPCLPVLKEIQSSDNCNLNSAISEELEDVKNDKFEQNLNVPSFYQTQNKDASKDNLSSKVNSSGLQGNSKSPVSKTSLESTLNCKRVKSIKVLDSSDSSSGDELGDLAMPVKRRRVASLTSSSSHPKLSPQLDSEEMRDFERYDDNVWKYFKDEATRSDKENAVRPNLSTQKAEKSQQTSAIILDSEDEDAIPSTADAIKNINSDLSLIRRMRQKKSKVLSDTESEPDTVDLCSQEDSMLPALTNDLTVSIGDKLTKCNKSLDLAREILEENQSENIPGQGENATTLSKLDSTKAAGNLI